MWHLHARFVVDMRIAVELGAWLVEQQFHDHGVDARHCWPVERVRVEATCREGKDFLVNLVLDYFIEINACLDSEKFMYLGKQ